MTAGLVLAATLIVGVVQAPAPPTGDGPSFDCRKARGTVPQLVCRDAGLAGRDRALADAFAKALTTWESAEARRQRSLQREWVKRRDACDKGVDVRACVEQAYRTRLVEVQVSAGQAEAKPPVSFECVGGEQTALTAVYYGSTDPPAVRLTLGAETVIAFQGRIASGTLYTAPDVEYREHQGGVVLRWFGATLTCRPPAP